MSVSSYVQNKLVGLCAKAWNNLVPEKVRILGVKSGHILGIGNNSHPDSGLTPDLIIKKHGYALESYKVVSEDGYILTLFRINSSQKCPPSPNKPVVFLMHGCFGSFGDWVLHTPEKALAFMLVDRGFDVFLGNARGTRNFGDSHFWLSSKNPEFWKFSWDQMGEFDIPNFLDKALEVSGQKRLSYVAHSMGCAAFMVALSTKPEYCEKVSGMVALAPACYVSNMTSFIKHLTPYATHIEAIVGPEFLPDGGLYRLLGRYIGVAHLQVQKSVWSLLHSVIGFNSSQINEDQLPIILQNYPICTSSRAIVHYTKLQRSKKFSAYDFENKKENLMAYGTESPPEYDLGKVDVPVALFSSENDYLVNPKDVDRLASRLPKVVGHFKTKTQRFNHADFLWAKDVDTLLNIDVIGLLEDFALEKC